MKQLASKSNPQSFSPRFDPHLSPLGNYAIIVSPIPLHISVHPSGGNFLCILRSVRFFGHSHRFNPLLQQLRLTTFFVKNSIDTKTDEIMQRVIREKFCNHTIIAVAHKLDTILDFDRIVVLDAGRIVENGEPYALLTEPKSHFSQLYASAMATEESD